MPTERDLSALLKNMKPQLQPGIFVFCTIAPNASLPAALNPLLTFREQEGTTLVIRREEAEAAGLNHAFSSRLITLTVNSALDAVGFLAAITARLAEAGISINAVSAFHHDHLFVPHDRADEAMALLLDMRGTNEARFSMERRSALHELLELKKPLDEILPNLDRVEQDSAPMVIIERGHVAAILRRHCEGDLNRHDVERWAKLVVSRNDIDYNSDAVLREHLLELALPADSQLTRERAGKIAIALIKAPSAKAVQAAARVLHDEALRHSWWGQYKKTYDELAATDSIGKYEFDGLVERMLIAAMRAETNDNQ